MKKVTALYTQEVITFVETGQMLPQYVTDEWISNQAYSQIVMGDYEGKPHGDPEITNIEDE